MPSVEVDPEELALICWAPSEPASFVNWETSTPAIRAAASSTDTPRASAAARKVPSGSLASASVEMVRSTSIGGSGGEAEDSCAPSPLLPSASARTSGRDPGCVAVGEGRALPTPPAGDSLRDCAAMARARRELRPPRGATEPTRSRGYGMSSSGSSSVVSPSSSGGASKPNGFQSLCERLPRSSYS